MPRKTRRTRARFYFVLVAALLAWCVVAIDHGDYIRAVWTGSFAVATACWIIAVLFPVRCAVTTRQGLPCRNAANGVLFGCSQSSHTWIKFRAHFGRHERVRTATAARAAPPPRSGNPAEARRSAVQFWLAIVATGAGFISMLTDVAGLFG
jgi:hypothetical protein